MNKAADSFRRTMAEIKANSGGDDRAIALIPPGLIENILETVKDFLWEWKFDNQNNLTLLQRRRKTGPGNSNYGFVDKVSDIALSYPEYANFINVTDLKNAIRNIEACRDIFALMQSFSRAVSNTMLVYSTEAFSIALDYYSQVRVRAERGDPQAIELYRILKQRFRMPRRTSAEPTVKEIERDIHAILTHKKDGEVLVEGERPKLTGGATKVVDNVQTGRRAFKETAEGGIKE